MKTALALALILLAGGGTEGEVGDRAAWSARLYAHLLDHGDVTGDGKLTVAVVSAHDETDFIPKYFRWLGAQDAYNVKVDSRAAASSGETLAAIDRADAVFLKGGNQGTYYKLWNDTPLEGALRRLVERHGAIGGTSAGAMSLAEIALAGGKSLVSADVLQDACTPMLDDEDGGSGLHTDFLGFVPDATIDTHFTERARLGRMLGVMARAASENRRPRLLGIGVAEQTGVVIEDGVARVIGADSVWFVQGSPDAALVRKPGQPLGYAPLVAHVLSDGQRYDLATHTVVPAAKAGEVHAGEIVLEDAQGEQRAVYQKRLAHELPLSPGTAGFLVTRGSRMTRNADGTIAFSGPASLVLRSRPDGAMTVGAYAGPVTYSSMSR